MPVAFSFGKNFSIPFCQKTYQAVCPHMIVKGLMNLINCRYMSQFDTSGTSKNDNNVDS